MNNKFSNFTKEELTELLKSSTSISEVFKKNDAKISGANYKVLLRECKKRGIESEYLSLAKRGVKMPNVKSNVNIFDIYGEENIFCENSNVSRNSIKRWIIRKNLVEYKCRCGIEGTWQGKDLILELEHKNGVSNDNRLENIEFLCPNCHSQTKTYSGRNIKRAKKNIKIENKKEENEIKRNLLVTERKEFLDTLDATKYGWVKKVQNEWSMSHTQIKRWIKLNYPEFKYFERNKPM